MWYSVIFLLESLMKQSAMALASLIAGTTLPPIALLTWMSPSAKRSGCTTLLNGHLGPLGLQISNRASRRTTPHSGALPIRISPTRYSGTTNSPNQYLKFGGSDLTVGSTTTGGDADREGLINPSISLPVGIPFSVEKSKSSEKR